MPRRRTRARRVPDAPPPEPAPPRPGFFELVYEIVRGIPRGRVATYGEVARLAGQSRGARAVGWALRALPEGAEPRVPWHRVVGSGGRISPRSGPGPALQERRLEEEGVAVRGGRIDLARHGLRGGATGRASIRAR